MGMGMVIVVLSNYLQVDEIRGAANPNPGELFANLFGIQVRFAGAAANFGRFLFGFAM